MSEGSDLDNNTGPCEVCEKPSERKCSACKVVFYCSVEHQKDHWKEHKLSCKPYEICHAKELGRYLKASRDLATGDIIFSELPIVFGPKPHKIEEGPFPCVGCCRLLYDQTCDRCPGCFWPVCKLECEGLKIAAVHGFECNVLRLKPPTEAKSFYDYYRFDVLIILRALYLQKANNKKWLAMLDLEDHLESRGPKTKIYRVVQEKVEILKENYLIPLKAYEETTGQAIIDEVPDDLIHKIYGILDVNATELTDEVDAEILYPTASLIEHNCLPNTFQTIDEKNSFKITFRAAIPIEKDEHITTIYTHILWGTSARRDHLKQTKYFSCTCKRCQDPTEFQSFVGALRCLGTEKQPCGGIQLPVNPTERNCEWVCDKCSIKLPNKDIMKFVNHLSSEVDKLLAKQPNSKEMESFLEKLLNFLHPNHYLVYSIKHSLVQLYGNEGDVDTSDEMLREKLKMCEDLIDITRKVDPANARLNLYLGVLLNEQFIAKFKLLSRSFNPDERDKFSDEIETILKIAEENKRILHYEINSPAGMKLFEVVCQNELKFKNWMENSLQQKL